MIRTNVLFWILEANETNCNYLVLGRISYATRKTLEPMSKTLGMKSKHSGHSSKHSGQRLLRMSGAGTRALDKTLGVHHHALRGGGIWNELGVVFILGSQCSAVFRHAWIGVFGSPRLTTQPGKSGIDLHQQKPEET